MGGSRGVHRAIGLRGPRIVAVAADPDGLDDLVCAGAEPVDLSDLTVLPAFSDAHEHLMEAGRNSLLVPVERARTVGEFVALIEAAVAGTPSGGWVVTSNGWNEGNLAENRFPTLAELDAVAPDHPVLARRGGHAAVANSSALALAHIRNGTPNPAGGSIGRLPDGTPNGLLEGAAVYQVAALAPAVDRSGLVQGLARVSGQYAALGVGSIREAMITPDELLAYRDAVDRHVLNVRARPLLRVPNDLPIEATTEFIDSLGPPDGSGNDWLRVWGLKFILDGGVEGGALEMPYDNDPTNAGHLNWEPDKIRSVMTYAARRGWRIATHAAGDRALRVVLDVYDQVLADIEDLASDTLVVEHALLAPPEQRARAIRMGIPITVQHALLWNMAAEMLTTWGPARTASVNPLDRWLAEGAQLAVGTDLIRPFNPMTSIWGMVTRQTRSAGIQGPEHAIDRLDAIQLYTVGSARLDREVTQRGSIEPGKLADFVGYRVDPFAIDEEDLAELTPELTVVGSHPTHDPDRRFPS
jgi:predicted amidohydrolase YtcJ